jgi:signal transduction histidine kinase
MEKRNMKPFTGWWLVVIQGALLVVLAWFGYKYHREFEQNLVDKYSQQLSHTASTARLSVLSYFGKFTDNLINLSHDPQIIAMVRAGAAPEKTLYCPLENLFAIHRNEIDALILMDTTSLIIKRIANDSADLHHMMCIGNPLANPSVPKDSVYYSDVFVNHKNQKAITLSCPVYDAGQRIGILRWMITIASIDQHFLNTVRYDQQVHFVITDQTGRLLSDQEAYLEWLCENMCRCEQFNIRGPVIDNYELLLPTGSGKLKLLPLGCKVYGAWNRFAVGHRDWKLMVMMPSEALEKAMRAHGIITWGITGVGLMIILSMTLLIISTRNKRMRLETAAAYLAELATTQQQLTEEREHRLSAQITGQEQERQRISRELHDGLGQMLLAMKLRMKEWIASSEGPTSDASPSVKFADLLNETIVEVKRISYGLSPVMLEELGIIKALERYCHDMESRTGVNIDCVSYGVTVLESNEQGAHLFRIVQEAVMNAIRHGRATEINIQLLAGSGRLTLLIQDNGSGFFPETKKQHTGNGLNNIRDRALTLGGTAIIESAPGEGTTITVKIPIDHE